jgi:DNA gyrase/topoisomerase IV subunit A
MTTPAVDLFEIATRRKFRFASTRGQLSTEQLWDLPLTSTNSEGVTLDAVARTVNQSLKAVTEESFVQPQKNTAAEELSQKLEVVKHVIAVKLAEREAATKLQEKAQRKQRILEVLAEKDNEALKGLSREELTKELAELG